MTERPADSRGALEPTPIRSQLLELYWRAERTITPGLRSSQYSYYEKIREVVDGSARWLDLGCGRQVFATWMSREQQDVLGRSRLVVGIDLDRDALRDHPGIQKKVIGDLTQLPVRHGSFDLITANMVVEHISQPDRLLDEIYRVLTPGGVFVFHTPNIYHWATLIAAYTPGAIKRPMIRFLEGRDETDVFRTYYRINSADTIRGIARRHGFKVDSVHLVSSSATLATLGPVAALELLYIRALRRPSWSNLRSNLIVALQKEIRGVS